VPLQPLLPVQQIVDDAEVPLTFPLQDVSPLQFAKHEFVAVHVTSSLHEPKPVQSTRQSAPLQMTLCPHASLTLQAMLHFCALQLMSSVHAAFPSQVTLHCEPPQLIGFVQDPPPEQ